MPDFSYRIDGMFALILPESPAGEKAMAQVMEMTDGTGKVFTSQLQTLKVALHAAGYTIRKRSVRKTCSKADIEHLFAQLAPQPLYRPRSCGAKENEHGSIEVQVRHRPHLLCWGVCGQPEITRR